MATKRIFLPITTLYPLQPTMSITTEQIISTASLARLKLQEREIGDVTERISSILDMVDQMQSIDTRDVEPMANSLDAVQYLRADNIDEPTDKIARRDQFLAIAPATEDGLFLVPKVIE